MLEQIFEYFKTNPGWSLVITIVSTALVWLYKEFKLLLNADQKNKLALVQKKMDLYSVVEAAAAQAINRLGDPVAIQYLYTKLGEASAYFTPDIRTVIRDYYERPDVLLLRTLMTFIKVESNKLEKEKDKLMKLDISGDMVETISRLFRPLKPILLLFGTVLLASVFLLNSLQEEEIIGSISWVIAFLTMVFSLTLIFVIISSLLDGSLGIRGAYRWGLSIAIITCPILWLLNIKFAIFSLGVQLISMVLFAKSKRKGLIVT
ncbi:hypothetical protein [Paenibacillus tengchongensis]|uniref:hypothetical protein n=1 Tax=Paenibacillus tengchongensis TaxID=2608684 RepID=UPI00124BE0A6|nr:hypothetical protein [Paenibacillus tengchongensis]